jgi:hypothetical protein
VFDDERGMNWPTEEEGGSRHKKKELGRYRDVADSEPVSFKTTRADDVEENGRNEITYHLSWFPSPTSPCHTSLLPLFPETGKLVEITCQFF